MYLSKIIGILLVSGVVLGGCEPISYVVSPRSKTDLEKIQSYCTELCDLLGTKMDGVIKHRYDNCFTCVCRPVDGNVDALPLCPQ
jgi:hypothetical protein